MATAFETARAKLTDLTTSYAQELAKYTDEAPPDATQLATLQNMKAGILAAKADVDAAGSYNDLRASWAEMQAVIEHGQAGGRAHPLPEPTGGAPKRIQTVGERFASSEAFREWHSRMAPNGVIPETTKGIQSPPMQFGGLTELGQIYGDLLTGVSSTSGGAFITAAQYLQLTELGRRPLTLRQIVTNLQTSSDLVEYVRVTTETNNAAPVAEATGAGDGTGMKPESALAFERVSTPVITIAHWIPATKRVLSDASQLRGLIDSFLRYGLEEELEDQIANGSGVGENFTGILNTSGTQAQAWDTNILKTTRIARRKVRTVGRRTPTAYILNPEDWETIDLLQDNEARYFFGGPAAMGSPRLWGLPVIESEAIPVGTGLVGDFSVCVLWDREQASISVSDSHSDFFTRNLVAILAELRAAFGILKPNAIVEIDLTA